MTRGAMPTGSPASRTRTIQGRPEPDQCDTQARAQPGEVNGVASGSSANRRSQSSSVDSMPSRCTSTSTRASLSGPRISVGRAPATREQAARKSDEPPQVEAHGRHRVVPAEYVETLTVQEAAQPAPRRPFAVSPVEQERLGVLDRVPEMHPFARLLARWSGSAESAGIREQGDVRAAEEELQHGEAGIALDQFQAPGAGVPLELHLERTAKPQPPNEPQAELAHLAVRVADRIAAQAEARRELANLAERAVGERVTVLVEVAAIGGKLVVPTRDDLADQHLEAQRMGLAKGVPQLRLIAGDDQFSAEPEVVLEEHRVPRFQGAGVLDLIDHRVQSNGVVHGHRHRRVDPELMRPLGCALLVEQRERDFVAPLDRQEAQLRQGRA